MASRVSPVSFTIIRERPLRCARLEEHVGKLPLQVFSGNFNGVHESGDAAIGDDLTIARSTGEAGNFRSYRFVWLAYSLAKLSLVATTAEITTVNTYV